MGFGSTVTTAIVSAGAGAGVAYYLYQQQQGTEHEKSPLGPEGVDARIDELKAEKAALEQQLAASRSEAADRAREVAALKAKTEEAGRARDDLSSAVSRCRDLETQVARGEEAKAKLQGELRSLISICDEQKSLLERITSAQGSVADQVEEEKRRHREELESLKAHARGLEGRIREAIGTAETAMSRASDLEGKLRSSEAKVAELDAQLAGERSRSARLSADRETMMAELAAYTDRVETLSRKFEDLTGSSRGAHSRLDEIEARCRSLQSDLEARTRERDALVEAGQLTVEEFERLREEGRGWAREREELHQAMAAAVRDYDAVIKKKDGYKKEVKRLSDDKKAFKAELQLVRGERDALVGRVNKLVTQLRAAGLGSSEPDAVAAPAPASSSVASSVRNGGDGEDSAVASGVSTPQRDTADSGRR